MSQSSNLPNNSSITTDASTGEEHKTQQAAAKATAKVAFEMAPEKIVVDSPPPKPNYPHYRVHPGEQFVLASVDPNASEDYKNKKDIEQELQHQRQRLQNLQERLYNVYMLNISAAYSLSCKRWIQEAKMAPLNTYLVV
ncbi:hypothetical protein NDI34_11600 [Trichocoleus sp. DQ-U1]